MQLPENLQFTNRGLGLLVIFSQDIAKSAEFYQSLGLRLERHAHPPCGEHFASDGECVFEIYPTRAGQPAASPMTFGFHVSSVDQAVEVATVNGGLLKRKPHDDEWGRSATVIDPDGHIVLLMEKPTVVNGES